MIQTLRKRIILRRTIVAARGWATFVSVSMSVFTSLWAVFAFNFNLADNRDFLPDFTRDICA